MDDIEKPLLRLSMLIKIFPSKYTVRIAIFSIRHEPH